MLDVTFSVEVILPLKLSETAEIAAAEKRSWMENVVRCGVIDIRIAHDIAC
jgi:hypothetical protein